MIKSLLTSRKSWLMVLAIALPIANKFCKTEIPEAQILAAIGAIIAAITGIAWEDAATKRNENGTKSPYLNGENK